MADPCISVVIPVYNGTAFLAEALASVLEQTVPPSEIIVADDGSTDSSASIASGMAGVTVMRLQHRGVSAARNAAVAASRGDWIAFLDADDLWAPNKLELQIRAATNEVDLVFCHHRFRFEGTIPDWFSGPRDGATSQAFEPSGWLVRRQILDDVGPFNEALSHGEDTEWLSRAWDRGVRPETVPHALVERRIHSSNLTGTLVDRRRLIVDILRESVKRKHSESGTS